MHPNNIEPELESSKKRIQQLEGLRKIKEDKYGRLLIRLFEKFSPFEIKHATDYGCYISFNHTLNFQATDRCFQEFAKETGLIPTAWWHDEKNGTTTIAFDKIFYPDSSALVND